MSHRLGALVLSVALFASACGSEPETVVVGAADDEPAAVSEVDDGSSDVAGEDASVDAVDETPAVAEASAPELFLEPCEIIGGGGPLDPADVLIDVAGGRWGDDVMSATTGRVERGFDPEPLDPEPCRPEILLDDCTSYLAFLDELVENVRTTGRDDDRDHELDNYAADVGVGAEAYVDVFEEWVAGCPTIEIEGEVLHLVELELEKMTAAELSVEAQQLWVAVSARENVFSMLVVTQDDSDLLRADDLADFERLVGIWQTRMENAPLS